MSTFTKILLAFLFLSPHFPTTSAGRATNQFKNWYPEYGFTFSHILTINCTVPYAAYLSGEFQPVKNITNRYIGVPYGNQLVEPVVNYILESTSEFIKANMGSAQVLLGLTPTILAILGPSPEEISILWVVASRPFLAFLIAAGSPVVFAMRPFEDYDPLRILEPRENRSQPPKLSWTGESILMFSEYTLALAAVANVVTLGYELGVQVVCSFAPHTTYIPLLVGFISLGVHASGVITLYLRTNIRRTEDKNSVWNLVKRQFIPQAKRHEFSVRILRETYLVVFLSWITSLLSSCLLIAFTLTFSSMIFISVRDSVPVIARYMASVLMCRVILMYELAVLRDSFNVATTPEVREAEVQTLTFNPKTDSEQAS